MRALRLWFSAFAISIAWSKVVCHRSSLVRWNKFKQSLLLFYILFLLNMEIINIFSGKHISVIFYIIQLVFNCDMER